MNSKRLLALNAPELTRKGASRAVSVGLLIGLVLALPRHATAEAPPPLPSGVLYDQYNKAGGLATTSQHFEPPNDLDDELADDFVVPGGARWSVRGVDVEGMYRNDAGPAASFNVLFYMNSRSNLPGTLVAERLNQSYSGGPDFVVNFSSPVVLSARTYWMSVQANMDFGVRGQWGWQDRTVQSNRAAAWKSRYDRFAICRSWGVRNTTCGIDPGVPDQVFRIRGSNDANPAPPPLPKLLKEDRLPRLPDPFANAPGSAGCRIDGHERGADVG